MTQKLWSRPFAIIMAINFMLFLSFNMLNPSLPIYFQDIGISETMTGVCISIFTVGSIIVRPIAGGVLDRFGRRAVFFVSMLILCGMVYAYALSGAIFALLLLRLVHGFDWGFASTATSTMATDIIPRQKIGTGMGIFGLSMSLALAFAPALAVNLMEKSGFEGMIFVSTAFLVVATLLGLCYPFHHTVTPSTANKAGKGRTALFEHTAVLPSVIMGCITLTMSAITTYVPLYALSLGMHNVGFFFTVYAIGLMVVRAFIGIVVDRFGIVAATIPSFISMLLAMLLLAFAKDLAMILTSGFLYGAGYGGAQTTMQSLAVMNAPAERFGAANGTFFIGFDLGIGFGALLAGILSDYFGFAPMYLMLSIFIVLAILLVLKFRPHKAA